MKAKQRRMGLYEELNAMRIAIWHPFGPHGGESAEEILERKQKECADAGETFWTFHAAGIDTVEFWRKEIRKHGGVVSALCIFRDPNMDPASRPNSSVVTATFWQSERGGTPEKIRPKIRATFMKPPGTLVIAGAFRVAAVDILEPRAYLRRQGKLLIPGSARALGRGQKLVQFGHGNESRLWKGEVAAILRLKEPWVVWVGIENSLPKNG